MSELKLRILEKLQEPALACLATLTEEGKPWVRYVTPYADENMNLWCATMTNSRKVSQIQKNNQVHLTLGCTDAENPAPYLQVQAVAEVLNDAASKQRVWGDHLSAFFSGPGDPNMSVLKIIPYRIELQSPEPVPPLVWEREQS